VTTAGKVEEGKRGFRAFVRRRGKVLLIAALALVAVASSAVIYSYTSGAPELDEARRQATERGLALTMTEFLRRLPDAPEGENAAAVYELAAASAAGKGIELPTGVVPLVSRSLYLSKPPTEEMARVKADSERILADPREPVPDYMLAATKEYVEARREAINLVHKGAALPGAKFHFTYQGYNTILPHLSKARSMTRMLALAAWVDAEEGRPREAVGKVRDSLAMARSLRNEPFLVSALVEAVCVSITVSVALPRVLTRTDVPNEDLEALQRDCEKIAEEFSIRLGLEGELAAFCDAYGDIRSGRVKLQQVIDQSRWYGLQQGTGQSAGSIVIAKMPHWLIKGQIDSDQAAGMRYLVDINDHVEGSPAELAQVRERFAAEMENERHLLAYVRSRTLESGPDTVFETRARLRSAAAALAALRFKNDTGKWPDTLATLVPKYLDKVPLDPYADAPLVYRVLDDGILVYSVGVKGKDDGGKLSPALPAGVGQSKDDDVGVRLWK